MKNGDDVRVDTKEEFGCSVEDAKAILKEAGMDEEGIRATVKYPNLVWAICHRKEEVLSWNEKRPDCPLHTLMGRMCLSECFTGE